MSPLTALSLLHTHQGLLLKMHLFAIHGIPATFRALSWMYLDHVQVLVSRRPGIPNVPDMEIKCLVVVQRQ